MLLLATLFQLNAQWDLGATDCASHHAPPIQVHAYDARTYILRENLCATFEAPFMYVLIGSRRALLIDDGDVADPHVMPIAQTVLDLLRATFRFSSSIRTGTWIIARGMPSSPASRTSKSSATTWKASSASTVSRIGLPALQRSTSVVASSMCCRRRATTPRTSRSTTGTRRCCSPGIS